MIAPEGRVLAGVDEFMLRLGHLTVTCLVAVDAGSNRYRLEEYLGERLTAPTTIPEERMASVAEYLIRKGLIRRPGKEADEVRYPDLVLVDHDSGPMIEDESGRPPAVWWQDYQLADPKVRSRVGGATIRAKSGSKSVLSHILDWATFLDLMTPAGDLTSWGKLLGSVFKTSTSDCPYAVTDEKIVFGWRVLQADFDVLARLAMKVSQTEGVIQKREATALFVQTVEQLEDEIRGSRSIRPSHADAVYAVYQDLVRAGNRSGQALAATSTAWHRASNRFESLVDLGLLAKPQQEAGAYSYQYLPTPELKTFAETCSESGEVKGWFDLHFANLFGADGQAISSEFVSTNIAAALALMESKSTLVPIDALLLSLLILANRHGQTAPLGELRSMLLDFVRANPSIARLSSGRYGKDAEFVSLRIKR